MEKVKNYGAYCKHCGEQGLCWEKVNSRWFLFDYLGNKHTCGKPVFKQAVKSFFEKD